MQSLVDTQVEEFQKIEFQGNDSNHTVDINAKNVTITPSDGSHLNGSSKIKLKSIVDYSWEDRFYTGRLLAVHMAGKYVAYGIKAGGKPAGVVRAVHKDQNSRALIKCVEGMVQDIAFAYIPQEILLACVDQRGNLYVHQVNDNSHGLSCTLLLHVLSDERSSPPSSTCHRVVWCPYIPEDGPKNSLSVYDDVAGLLALTRGNKIELWNVPMVKNKFGVGPIRPGTVKEGYLEVNEHSQAIVDASFSPDGTAIATASYDGEVKFFQVYMQNETAPPRCLHQWKPHNGKPLSSLFFLDNHKTYNPEAQFWKYAITGANENSELKLWSCETWSCLQTIRFVSREEGQKLQLKACMDLASGYLLLTDHTHRVFFVLQVQKDASETNCFIHNVSEFKLPYTILSFGIVDAGSRKFKSDTFDTFALDVMCNGDAEEEDKLTKKAVFIKMFLVQPKSLQECHVVYNPLPLRLPQSSISNNSSQNSVGYHTEDLELPIPFPESVPVVSPSSEPLSSSLQLNLMTPDAFSSSLKRESPSSSTVLSHADEAAYGDIIPDNGSASQSPLPDSTPAEGAVGFASGGSSPSREVQKIFSLQGNCYFEDSNKPLPQQVEDVDQDADVIESTKPSEEITESNWRITPPNLPVLIPKESRTVEEDQININRNEQVNQMTLVEIKNINKNFEVIQMMLQKTQEDIKCLKDDINTIKRPNNLWELENNLSMQIQQQNSLIESFLENKDNDRNQEVLLSAISQTIDNLVATKLEDIVTSEINCNVLPAVTASLETLKQDIHIEMTQKLSTTDHLLKENITKLVNSKSVVDMLGTTLMTAIKPCLADALKECFMSMAIPSYEKACAAMFSQLNETFSKGTKEYIGVIETLTRKLGDKTRDTNEQIQNSVDTIKTITDRMSRDVTSAVSRIEIRMGEAFRAQNTAF